MRIINNIEKYYTLLDEKKEWYLEKFKKTDFISASRLFILNNTDNYLLEIISLNSSSDRIKLKSIIKSDEIIRFFKITEELRDVLKNEAFLVEKEIKNIVKLLNKTDETILNNIMSNLLKEVIEQEFVTKRIIKENDSDYVYIFSRMDKKQKKNLVLIIDKFYKNVNKFVFDFKKFKI